MALAACDDRSSVISGSGPLLERTPEGGLQQEGYRHFEEFVELTPEPGTYIVEATDGISAVGLSDRLAAAGLQPAEVRKVERPGAVYEVQLSSNDSMTRDLVLSAAAGADGISFIAPLYRDSEGALIRPLNLAEIQFRGGTTIAERGETLERHGMELVSEPVRDSGRFAHRVRSIRVVDAYRVINALWEEPIVEWAALDALNDGRKLMQTGPHFGLQYYLQNATTLGGIPVDINVTGAWAHSTGAGIRVAVIDDGVDVLHSNWGGGFSGDLVGAFAGSSDYDLMSWLASGDNELNPYGDDYHGTAVAGIIAMRRNNGVGGVGVAPDALLSVARIFRQTHRPTPSSPATQFASELEVAAALNWAWSSAGADVVISSWAGGMPHPSITAAIDSGGVLGRSGKGTLYVFSAGNNPSPGSYDTTDYPALLSATRPYVMAVSSITSSGAVASYAPTAGIIDVVAPSGNALGDCSAGDVFSLDPYDSDGCNNGPSGDQAYSTTFSGTSASAPQVAGMAALLLELAPTLTASQVKTQIRNSATSWPGGGRVGMGKVNAMAMLAPYLPAPLSASIVGPALVASAITCTYTSTVSGGSPSYAYEWRVNGVLVGTGASVNVNTPGSGAFTVDLKVTDSVGAISNPSLNVFVDPWAAGCGF